MVFINVGQNGVFESWKMIATMSLPRCRFLSTLNQRFSRNIHVLVKLMFFHQKSIKNNYVNAKVVIISNIFGQKWPFMTSKTKMFLESISSSRAIDLLDFKWISMIFNYCLIGFRGRWYLDILSVPPRRFSYYLWFVVPQRFKSF